MEYEKRGRCPNCRYIFELATHIDDENIQPKKGDISFCINCGAVNQFSDVGVIPVNEEILPNSTRREIVRIRNAWRKMKSKEGEA